MKTTSFGIPFVEIRLIGDSFDEAYQAAREFAEAENGLMVPPFDDEEIILGQATVGKEIIEQLNGTGLPDHVIMPVGGGGLSAGVTQYLKFEAPNIQFTFVEPENAASLKASLQKSLRIKLSHVDGFVDGAAVAQIGELNFEYLKHFSSAQVIEVPTNGICATMMDLLNVEGIVLEPAGALAIDALKYIETPVLAGKRIVCVVSGGNFDFERLPEVKERALKFAGKKKYFILRLPQRPGALKDFLLLLGPDDDISRFEYLKKSARNFGSVLIGIETARAENFDELKQRLDEAGFGYQDITDNELVSNLVI